MASITPSSPVNTKVGQTTVVTVSFVTSDESPLAKTNLSIASGLSNLPAGWTLSSNTCSSLNATASSCQINLAFAPSNVESGNLSFNYSYVNNQNVLSQKTLTIDYAGTVNNNATYTVSPAAPLRALAGLGHSYPVSINFTTDDGNVATNLTIPPSILPTGWKFASTPSSTTPLCPEFGPGKPCVLNLVYTPATYNSVPLSTLNIPFSYNAEDGQAKTGNATYTYSAGTNDSVIVNMTPSNAYNTHINTNTTVTLQFTTNDQNQASNLQLNFPILLQLYHWSNTSSLNCATIPSQNSGSTCTITLQFAPTYSISNTSQNLTYTYTKSDGQPGTGSITLYFSSLPPIFAYATDETNSTVQKCIMNADGTLSSCQTTGNNFSGPAGIAFQSFYAYIANFDNGNNTITKCQVNADGTLGSCTNAGGSGFDNPYAIAFNNDNSNGTLYAYVINDNNGTGQENYDIMQCPVATDGSGTLGTCTQIGTNPNGAWPVLTFQTVNGQAYAYVTSSSNITRYLLDSDGTFGASTSFSFPISALAFQTVNNILYAYTTSDSTTIVNRCTVNTDGSFTACSNAGGSGFVVDPNDITFQTLGNDPSTAKIYAYIANEESSNNPSNGSITQCLVNSTDGTFSSCTSLSSGSFGSLAGIALNYYNPYSSINLPHR